MHVSRVGAKYLRHRREKKRGFLFKLASARGLCLGLWGVVTIFVSVCVPCATHSLARAKDFPLKYMTTYVCKYKTVNSRALKREGQKYHNTVDYIPSYGI